MPRRLVQLRKQFMLYEAVCVCQWKNNVFIGHFLVDKMQHFVAMVLKPFSNTTKQMKPQNLINSLLDFYEVRDIIIPVLGESAPVL